MNLGYMNLESCIAETVWREKVPVWRYRFLGCLLRLAAGQSIVVLFRITHFGLSSIRCVLAKRNILLTSMPKPPAFRPV